MSILIKHFRRFKSIFVTLMFVMIASVSPRTAWATEPTNVIFIHGANVSEQDARAWASEMFKRLWHSGAQMEFHPIAWESDIGPAYNYHVNASNAFVTASRVAPLVNQIAGRKVVIAHSLGTMVAAAAIQDYGMQVDKLIMLNSHLTMGIPALSPPTGRTDLSSVGVPSFDMNSEEFMPNAWPRTMEKFADLANRHLHSDVKDVAYFYVHPVFSKIVEVGGLR